MSQILFKFESGETTKNRDILADRNASLKEIFTNYLQQTGSIITFDLQKIQFLSKAKVLNSDKFLNKKAKEIFNQTVTNTIIKVIDSGNVLGGWKMNN